MREILFRGKWTNNGEWVEGYFGESRKKDICYIIKRAGGDSCSEYFIDFEVNPETIGQFTGLLDKNGKHIFEGDIINIEYPETTVKNCIIEYVGASFVGSTRADNWELDGYYLLEVIGNIHDNPELFMESEDTE